MNSSSKEFDNLNQDSESSPIARRTFRVPVEGTSRIWVDIENTRYPVLDISPDGIGISARKTGEFSIGQIVINCNLHIHANAIKNLKGRVIQLSFVPGGGLKCGILWLDMDTAKKNQLVTLFLDLKKQLLNDNRLSAAKEV